MKRPPPSHSPHPLHEPAFVAAASAPSLPAENGRRQAPSGLGHRMVAVTCVALLLGACWIFVAQPEQRLYAAEQRLEEARRANAALQALLTEREAPEGPAPELSAPPAAPDALIEALSEALDRPLSLGQVALHPDEGAVGVRIADDAAWGKGMTELLRQVARTLAEQPGPWDVRVEVGRPRGGGRLAPFESRWAAMGGLLHTLDETLGPPHAPWALAVGGCPPGEVRLMLRPLGPQTHGSAAQ